MRYIENDFQNCKDYVCMKQDVAVIGGSAAGLLTASLLAEKGVDVTVFEASKHLAEPKRTLIVTHQLCGIDRPSQ